MTITTGCWWVWSFNYDWGSMNSHKSGWSLIHCCWTTSLQQPTCTSSSTSFSTYSLGVPSADEDAAVWWGPLYVCPLYWRSYYYWKKKRTATPSNCCCLEHLTIVLTYLEISRAEMCESALYTGSDVYGVCTLVGVHTWGREHVWAYNSSAVSCCTVSW